MASKLAQSAAGVLLLLPVLVLAQPALSTTDCGDKRQLPGAGQKCRPAEKKLAPSGEQIPKPKLEDYSGKASVPVPDRWRIVDAIGYTNNFFDPYNRNTLKGDLPVYKDWFFNVTAIADTIYEKRELPTPVGIQSTNSAGDLDLFGGTSQYALIQQLAVELVYYKGDTVFRPPDYEFRLTPVFNHNHTEIDEILGISVFPKDGKVRSDKFVGWQAAFVDVHLRNVSERYDFDSVRVGIQPFNTDFRGFLFQDNQPGIRLFGTRNNNIFQYNVAWFRRLEKDTNSGLNDLGEKARKDDIFIANLYWQDLLAKGHISQFTIVHNRNRENDFFYDDNGFIQRPFSFGAERPRDYDITYLGYNTDGHLDRLNLTTSLYYAFGEQENGPFVSKKTDIQAWFAAAEMSVDQSWIRWRASLLYGSGDDDPFDDVETGFDAIVENPQFAGADTSYWIRQAVPLVAGGKVALSSRNGILNSLKASKEHGQSNFTNPGIFLAGLGVDLDILPELRLSANYNRLQFDTTKVLEVARQQANISDEIGDDVSVSAIWRPLMSQNVVVRLSWAELHPGEGYEVLFGDDKQQSILFNAVLTY